MLDQINQKLETVVIVLTVCGNRTISETSDNIKSVIVLTKQRIDFIIFTDNIEVELKIKSLVFVKISFQI
jgi:hypothetical protein